MQGSWDCSAKQNTFELGLSLWSHFVEYYIYTHFNGTRNRMPDLHSFTCSIKRIWSQSLEPKERKEKKKEMKKEWKKEEKPM